MQKNTSSHIKICRYPSHMKMRGSGLLLALICASLVACSTAQKSFGRRLWTVTSGKNGCSVQCDIFSGKCPYPSKCTNSYWLRRVQVSCFKRGMQLYRSGGEVFCRTETDPTWSVGIGRPIRSRRLSTFIRRLARTGKAVAADLSEGDVPRRMLRRSAAFEEVMERRRLMGCGYARLNCPHRDCKCECKQEYLRCFSRRMGSQCTNVRRIPLRVCNGQRCIWDWKGYTPPMGLARDVEYCLNEEIRCENRCTSTTAPHRPSMGLYRI